MLKTNSIELKGTETFTEAYALIPQLDKALVRYLCAKQGQDTYVPTNVAQVSIDDGKHWTTKTCKYSKDGQLIPIDLNSKKKLEHTGIIYDIYSKPVYAGADATQSWFVGNIDKCRILGDDYNIQGLIISNIFDPTPRYYISFERIVCSNQFSTLGKNNASMYIDMNKFLHADAYTDENKEKLVTLIQDECEKRINEAEVIYNKLATTHLTDAQIRHMFEMLTVDKVAKANEEKYHEAEKELASYMRVYNLDDNQNFKGSLFGFVNACTNINTRTRTNPLDVIKPALPADVVNAPCNFDYLCRAAMLQNV